MQFAASFLGRECGTPRSLPYKSNHKPNGCHSRRSGNPAQRAKRVVPALCRICPRWGGFRTIHQELDIGAVEIESLEYAVSDERLEVEIYQGKRTQIEGRVHHDHGPQPFAIDEINHGRKKPTDRRVFNT
jgi:hypothetical protein